MNPLIIEGDKNKELKEHIRALELHTADQDMTLQFVVELVAEMAEKLGYLRHADHHTPTWSESHIPDTTPVGTIKEHPNSEKLELWFDGRGWMTRVKSDHAAVPPSPSNSSGL